MTLTFFFFKVQELHGSSWTEAEILPDGCATESTNTSLSTPPLSYTGSVESSDSIQPTTPPRLNSTYNPRSQTDECHEVEVPSKVGIQKSPGIPPKDKSTTNLLPPTFVRLVRVRYSGASSEIHRVAGSRCLFSNIRRSPISQ